MGIKRLLSRSSRPVFVGGMLLLLAGLLFLLPWSVAVAGQSSVSSWDAADFRIWGFVPYWTPQSQLSSFPADGVYSHVSDVIYFGGVQPRADGTLYYHPYASAHLASLRSHAASNDFRLHVSMFTVSGDSVEEVWNSITANPINRARFVSNVVNMMDANDMVGFNLDWERPNTVSEWANYTQLAKDLKAALGEGREVSVDDYGFADSRWDDSSTFDARTYDQLFIMGYHYPATGSGSLNHNYFANTKLALTDQGADKAFQDGQLVLGIGTWGANGPATVSLKNIVAVDPDLPGDATSFSGTVTDINGTSRTGTWEIESRYEVRDKVQLALDRNMAGVMSWTLHYDATNQLSLHRVAHHYLMFQRGIPDLNLDGRVNAADAQTLSVNMGSVPGWTGTNTAARFEDFYTSGNWEQGDRDGNGFVNQDDADWLADRFNALGVNLPDRLAYTGTFENFSSGQGIEGRWRAGRDALGNLDETGNFQQHGGGYLSFSGSGIGADKHGNRAVTLRNQNAAEAFDTLNTDPRRMSVDLTAPIDLRQDEATYVTFLVRQNAAPLLASQASSAERELSLQFLDAAGDNQFDFTFFGLQEQFAIRNQADLGGADAAGDGFEPDATYLFVGKILGNGLEANTIEASLFAEGATIDNFADAGFDWMIAAEGSESFNPVIAQVQFESLYESNYTVSNVWVGTASDFALPEGLPGDYNDDGTVNAADYIVWRNQNGTVFDLPNRDPGQTGDIGRADYDYWVTNFGTTAGGGSSNPQSLAVPEPATLALLFVACWPIARRTMYATPRT